MKWLKQKITGEVYPFTELLSKRADMELVEEVKKDEALQEDAFEAVITDNFDINKKKRK